MRPIPYRNFKHIFREGAVRHGLLYESSVGKWHEAHVFKLRANPKVQCMLLTHRTGDVEQETLRLQRQYLYSCCRRNEAARMVLRIHTALCGDSDLEKPSNAA